MIWSQQDDLGAVMGGQDSRRPHAADPRPAEHRPAEPRPAEHRPEGRAARRRGIAASLAGALGVTVVSLVFIASFIGALHDPGPRSVPVGIAAGRSQVTAFGSALARQAPGGYTVIGYPDGTAARHAITTRGVDAALVPGTPVPVLLVATATGSAVTNAIIGDILAAGRASGLRIRVQDIMPLHSSDPEGLSQVFFVIALLAPSLVFGNALVTRVATDLHPLLQLAAVAVYAVIVAAVAITLADAVIGALTGAPWGLFGIGSLLAFAAAVTAAATARWAGGVGYLVVFLLLIPVGVASSGTTLGPNMITPWYADLGRALPAGAALPAVQNTVYFAGNAITTPLLVLSAWAAAGAIALGLVAVLRPPLRGHRARERRQAPG